MVPHPVGSQCWEEVTVEIRLAEALHSLEAPVRLALVELSAFLAGQAFQVVH